MIDQIGGSTYVIIQDSNTEVIFAQILYIFGITLNNTEAHVALVSVVTVFPFMQWDSIYTTFHSFDDQSMAFLKFFGIELIHYF